MLEGAQLLRRVSMRTPRVHLQKNWSQLRKSARVMFHLDFKMKLSQTVFHNRQKVASEEFLNSYVASGLGKHLKQDSTTSKNTVTKQLEQAANKFCGKPLSKIYVLEIFAGSARLSKAALEQGFASIVIDHKRVALRCNTMI